jgi:hypothetical protein
MAHEQQKPVAEVAASGKALQHAYSSTQLCVFSWKAKGETLINFGLSDTKGDFFSIKPHAVPYALLHQASYISFQRRISAISVLADISNLTLRPQHYNWPVNFGSISQSCRAVVSTAESWPNTGPSISYRGQRNVLFEFVILISPVFIE